MFGSLHRDTRSGSRRSRVAVLLAAALFAAACGAEDPPEDADEGGYSFDEQPEAAAAMLTSPVDGDTVSSPVPVELSADAVDIVAAGAPEAGEAHLHVIVDTGCVETGELIPGPSDEATADGYNHFGDGSTEGEIELEPGEYELCVQLADGVHRAFGETEVIEITVE
jgi:hypothetical protein